MLPGRQDTAWPKQKIEELLRTEDFRYQRVDSALRALDRRLRPLGHGGQDLSADLSGKSVLDIGSSFGYFCFEALKRGAARVVGYDVDPDSVRKARLLASCLGAAAEFEQRDIERDPVADRFDYVLCLNVLHHLKDPIAALDNLLDRTRERLVLEIAGLDRHERRKVGVPWLSQQLLSRLPIMFVSEGGTRGRRQVQRFYMTPHHAARRR